jgi:4-amino-4-deoxy-L-arabinose transferase-like glycosyltransferase
MPWFGFLPQTIRHVCRNWNWKKPSTDMFMVLWIILPLLFFSAAHSKLVPYIIPILPPMAILIARYWSSATGEKYTGILACAAIMIFLAIAALAALAYPAIAGEKYAELLAAASPALLTLAAIAGIGAVIAFLWRRHSDWAMIAIAIGALGTFLAADNAAGKLDRKSIKPLAEAILPQLQGGGKKVASYYFYPQDLPYYIGQTIIIVGWIGELEFATTAQDTSHTLIDDAQFWQDWKNRRIDFVFMPKSAYDQLDDAKKQLLLPWVFDSNVIVAQNRTK